MAEIKKTVLRQTVVALGKLGALDWFGGQVEQRLPGVVRIHGLNEDFEGRFFQLTSDGCVPLIYTGHFNHLDPVVLSHVSESLISKANAVGVGENLRGFVATVAITAANGKQSRVIEAFYPRMKKYAAERGVKFIEMTRDKDKRDFNEQQTQGEAFKLGLNIARSKGIGTLIMAGGSVEPGRHEKGKAGDDVKGLQEIKDTDLTDTFRLMERAGQRFGQTVYFLPVGVDRTYRFFNSDSLLPTPEGVISFYNGLSKQLTYLGFTRMYVDIEVGTPITREDLEAWNPKWEDDISETNGYLMRQAAKCIPARLRGCYG